MPEVAQFRRRHDVVKHPFSAALIQTGCYMGNGSHYSTTASTDRLRTAPQDTGIRLAPSSLGVTNDGRTTVRTRAHASRTPLRKAPSHETRNPSTTKGAIRDSDAA